MISQVDFSNGHCLGNVLSNVTRSITQNSVENSSNLYDMADYLEGARWYPFLCKELCMWTVNKSRPI
jgi:hypothetical protein